MEFNPLQENQGFQPLITSFNTEWKNDRKKSL